MDAFIESLDLTGLDRLDVDGALAVVEGALAEAMADEPDGTCESV